MALLNPHQIGKVLADAGLTKTEPKSNLEALLVRNGLSPDEVIEELGNILRGAETSAIKLQAAKVGLELNGLLKGDEVRNIPIVNIVINDGEHTINPILLPRMT